ncbi:MAG TPA: helix-turn-helix domain-containing GNAT family N-acetyltransferase [Pseudolabrys sp.]|uniref:bifunctional helix-turn-helix transcriptional regulator/GNAT family N-acetyltransferase n=1 Tax=Pseudolabrys sp. TaxID=1960880 RepID=UPI002DDCDDA2|nr:helix-turn-helix domain-containing GNAT family N-acetyltransferase [Pseudolabrys sp.]HEV2627495.1 helix-turn-helix domain-containing GNAT family N-acetyltransferase [Pseudolabrys sp.]
MPGQEQIAAVRRFNRFYTRQIGVLRRNYLDSPYSLGEMRVLYEIAHGATTARDIGRALDLDAGYLSRTLRNFEKRGFLSRKTSKTDARASELALTARGHKAFAPFEDRSQQQVADMLAALAPDERARLVNAMGEIESLLDKAGPAPKTYTLRSPTFGDFGWIVSRHAELYAQEYGWSEPFEGLCAGIVADFANKNDPNRERCWIAEMNGENVGCVMLAKDNDEVARVRLLLVDPKARGLGLGARLVEECVTFAREAGYKRVTLWTHSILAAARRIYEKAGFTLTSSEKRHTWGKDVVAEYWDLDL